MGGEKRRSRQGRTEAHTSSRRLVQGEKNKIGSCEKENACAAYAWRAGHAGHARQVTGQARCSSITKHTMNYFRTPLHSSELLASSFSPRLLLSFSSAPSLCFPLLLPSSSSSVDFKFDMMWRSFLQYNQVRRV